MVFSSASGEYGIVEDSRFLAGVDSAAFATADVTRCVNRWYYNACLAAWESSADWQFDDSNVTGFPIATTTLVASQPDYSIPTNALTIDRVEVKDNAGNYAVVSPIDDTQISQALDEFMETDGLPRYYRLVKNSIILYPAPAAASVTTSAGLKIYFTREVDEFATSDTSQEPGLPEPFHRILSFGAASDFALAKGLPNHAALKTSAGELMAELRKFMARRHVDFKGMKFRPRLETYI